MQPLKVSLIFIFLCVFVSLDVTSQPVVNNYEKQWKQVNELVKKQLPKSA